jgi:hypothetical protein
MERYDVDYCPSCKGVWLDRGEIDKIAKIQSNYDDEIITNTIIEKEIMIMTTTMMTTAIIITDEERVNMNIKSNTASKEQINELREIGKRFSPAFGTLSNGTSVNLVDS